MREHTKSNCYVGMVCSDGVILGTDTRSTEDHIVADHNCSKLHRLADNISAAGAGMAADLDQVTEIVAADLDLFRKQVGLMPRVQTCVARLVQKLFKYQGHIAAYLIVAGVDPSGEEILFCASHTLKPSATHRKAFFMVHWS